MRGDHLPVDDFLGTRRELATIGPSGEAGYRDGFDRKPVADWSQAEHGFEYRVWYGRGIAALARGAHQGAEAS